MTTFFLAGKVFDPTTAGYRERDKFLARTWTAEDHRAEAVRLLGAAGHGDEENRLAAAQVHATLALTAPEAAGVPADTDQRGDR